MNIYLTLTHDYNEGRLRAIISSGQAVVLHRLAIMSKVLQRYGARYRYGAPLDLRWMAEGWSSHFEFQHDGLRVRTDFCTRPPRLTDAQLAEMWSEHRGQEAPFVNVRILAELKKTNREKDYAVIGELARIMTDVSDQLRYSRSARDLIAASRESGGRKGKNGGSP